MLASCSPQPNWMPRKPKLMLNICQKLRRVRCIGALSGGGDQRPQLYRARAFVKEAARPGRFPLATPRATLGLPSTLTRELDGRDRATRAEQPDPHARHDPPQPA